MKCPACSSALSHLVSEGVELDVCREACGGVWFDHRELAKFDYQTDIAPALFQITPNKQVAVDMARLRSCPRCTDVTLHRFLYPSQPELELDECTKCGGIWLDLGELQQFRNANSDAAHREKVVRGFVEQHSAKSGGRPLPKAYRAVIELLFK